jgi:hypothetical protein
METPLEVALIGLGGGTIPMFLREYVANSIVHCVEIDAIVAGIARKFFGFKEDARTVLKIDDGLKYIEAEGKLSTKEQSKKELELKPFFVFGFRISKRCDYFGR